ncbi:hypothetical protein F511_37506 [Dorcoceras hygrometricum]|uniref:Uncharacterized protein n=1 Tax=Dorcoceras hygrometricum TaxID=472368 RepID=A0A2Z7D4S0_9LAMI|nr:hypothetical protein F511_37506 [Dorcoceras hygrometricum]
MGVFRCYPLTLPSSYYWGGSVCRKAVHAIDTFCELDGTPMTLSHIIGDVMVTVHYNSTLMGHLDTLTSNLKIVLASKKLLYTLEKSPPKEAPANASPEELAKLEKWWDDELKAWCYIVAFMSTELQQRFEKTKYDTGIHLHSKRCMGRTLGLRGSLLFRQKIKDNNSSDFAETLALTNTCCWSAIIAPASQLGRPKEDKGPPELETSICDVKYHVSLAAVNSDLGQPAVNSDLGQPTQLVNSQTVNTDGQQSTQLGLVNSALDWMKAKKQKARESHMECHHKIQARIQEAEDTIQEQHLIIEALVEEKASLLQTIQSLQEENGAPAPFDDEWEEELEEDSE